MNKTKWTKTDAAINKAARNYTEETEKIYQDLKLPHDNPYGESVGTFEAGVAWAMKHYKMLGFIKKK